MWRLQGFAHVVVGSGQRPGDEGSCTFRGRLAGEKPGQPVFSHGRSRPPRGIVGHDPAPFSVRCLSLLIGLSRTGSHRAIPTTPVAVGRRGGADVESHVLDMALTVALDVVLAV